MATNPAANYGTDLRGAFDSDDLFTAVTGIESVEQDAFHRITTDDVVGPGGVGWGYNVIRLLGMPARDIPAQQAVYAEVLQRDERILSAAVTITATTVRGLTTVSFRAVCLTAQGPFTLIIQDINDLTSATIEGQAA